VPLVSVVIPLYKSGPNLFKSIYSMLNQNINDVEVVVILNGSDTETENQMDSITHSKLKIFELKYASITDALNLGITQTNSEFIARQDADDWSSIDRFSHQINYLNLNKTCGVIGTWAYLQDERSKNIGILRKPVRPEDNRLLMNFENTIIHSSVMIRRKHLIDTGLYKDDKSKGYPEDLDLWLRILNKYEIANLPKLLHTYTLSEAGVSRIYDSANREKSAEILKTNRIKDDNTSKFHIIIDIVNIDIKQMSRNRIHLRTIFKSLKLLKKLGFSIINIYHLKFICKFLIKSLIVKTKNMKSLR
jgi:glycosyltransferase involved in cell wall biosynthesis